MSHRLQSEFEKNPRRKATWAAVEFALQRMMRAALSAWMERQPAEELLIDEVGLIVGGGPGKEKGQPVHSDVSPPENFGLGVLTESALPRVFKEGGFTRNELMLHTRRQLGVADESGLSPALPQGRVESFYFGARLLVLGKKALDDGMCRPFHMARMEELQDPPTDDFPHVVKYKRLITAPASIELHAYDVKGSVGDVLLIPGGTP